jgi:agmatinase
MDEAKLKQLRARYANRDVFDGDDPVLVAAARQVQSSDGKRSLPYSGIPTFLDLPSADSAAGLDIALVGVPMDLGVSNRPGARFGPRAAASCRGY